MRILLILIFCTGQFTFCLRAQKINEAYQLHLKRAGSPIKIDGIIDEPAWEEADVASDFYMVLPMDTSKAKVTTEVRMAYDEHNLYLVGTCPHI